MSDLARRVAQGGLLVVRSTTPMAEPKPIAEMLSDSMREVAELVLVFGVLDEVLKMQTWVEKLAWASLVIGVSVLLYVAGVVVERTR